MPQSQQHSILHSTHPPTPPSPPTIPINPPRTPDTNRALLERNPDDVAALEGLAVTQARLGRYDEAANLLDKLVAKRPGAFGV